METNAKNKIKLPALGQNREEVFKKMSEFQKAGANWHDGRTFSLVYHYTDEHTDFLKKVYSLHFHENGLNPGAFPAIRKYEAEVVSMACHLLGAGEKGAGTMTSGGTESIMMAVKTARDYFYDTKKITKPEMIVPISIHPAFCKAAHYFGVKPVYIPLAADFRVDLEKVKAAVNENTVLIVGSAPQYPHGVIDPIPELAKIAKERGIAMHVDACVGGFALPFLKKLGYDVAPFDFSVDGVTSMSADLHKYGFASKGASVVLYKDADYRRYQFFVRQDWPGGLFASPSMTGTRPAGSIAAAWANFMAMGESGYLKMHEEIMSTAKKFQAGVTELGFEVLGKPVMGVFAYKPSSASGSATQGVNIYVVADLLEKKGWYVDRQIGPDCIHLMITPAHTPAVDQYLKDLKEARDYAKAHPELGEEGMAAMYGMVAKVPDPSMIQQFLYQYMEDRYTTEEQPMFFKM